MKTAKKGMRSTPKAVQTRAHILATALALFQERSYEETTMRDIASAAGMSVGSSYYYFHTKEELILEFYASSCNAFRARALEIFAEKGNLKERLSQLLHERLAQLRPYRPFLTALTRSAMDPRSALSPFSTETKEMRNDAIAVFEELLAGQEKQHPAWLLPQLPRLLWIYHMGIVLYWVYDRSEEEQRTKKLIDSSVGLIATGLKIAKLPLMAGFLKPLLKTVAEFGEAAEVSH